MAYTLGVDINSRYSQLSAYTDHDKAPVPVSAIMGQDRYEIPTMLGYIKERNIWTYGFEALSLGNAGGAYVVDDLLERAVRGENITVHGEDYAAIDLLELYIKKLLGMANMIAPFYIADSIVFCVEFLNLDIIKLINKVINNLGINPEKTTLMSHSECIHHYMIHQVSELHIHDVLLIDYSTDRVMMKLYYKNQNSTPIVCSTIDKSFSKDILDNDDEFYDCVSEFIRDRYISSVYFIGDEELKDSLPKSWHFLVSSRRAFMGRNLYTRGACYASWDIINQRELKNKYFFFGSDKVKCNVGIYANDRDGESYDELIEAGCNWYDVIAERKYYLGSKKELRFILRPIDGSGEYTKIIRLDQFPSRPDHTTYFSLKIIMDEPDVMSIFIKDLGFGQIFPASQLVVEEKIELNRQGM